MNINDVIDMAEYKGLSIVGNNANLGTVLAGDRTGTNLVKAILDSSGQVSIPALYGSSLSPHQYIVVDGERVPGPMFNGLVKLKEMNKFVDGELVSDGLYWEVNQTVVSLNGAIMGLTGQSVERVKEAMADDLGALHIKHVLEHRNGVTSRASAAYGKNLNANEISISLPEAKGLLKRLQTQMSENPAGGIDEIPTCIEDLSGLTVLDLRFPIADRMSIATLTLRVIKNNVLVHGIKDSTQKGKGGDFDGDPDYIRFAEDYLGSLQYVADKGSLPLLEDEQDAAHFGIANFTLTDVKYVGRPDSAQMAGGMMAKTFQGSICNGFGRMSIAASVLVAATPRSADCNVCGGSTGNHWPLCQTLQAQLAGRPDYNSLLDSGKVTAWVTGEIAISALPAYEVIFDFRKYQNGDPERFEQGLNAMLDVFGNKSTKFGTHVAGIDKDKRSLDVPLLDSVMEGLEGENLRDFLDRYPVQGSLVGFTGISTTERREKTRRLAKIIAHNPQAYLDCAAGHIIESPDMDIVEGESTVGMFGKKKRLIGRGTNMPAMDYGNAWQGIARHAAWAGSAVNYNQASHSLIVEGLGSLSLEPVSFKTLAPRNRARLGCVVVQFPGGEKRVSRLFLRSEVANIPQCREVGNSVLVTLLDLLGEFIANQVIRAKTDKKEALAEGRGFDWNLRAEMIRVEITEFIKKNSRASGMSDKGERVNGAISLDQVECDVVQVTTAGLRAGMDYNVQILESIQGKDFVNPISGEIQRFDVGLTSKNKPGSVASLVMPVMRETGTGARVEYSPARPVLEYAVNGWITTDRQMRESRTVRFACELLNKRPPAFRTGFEHLMPSLTDRRVDGVWVAVDGLSSEFFSAKEYNGDMVRITPQGMLTYQRRMRHESLGPWPIDICEDVAAERGFASLAEMKMAGWQVKPEPRYVGRVDGTRLYENLYTLTSPGYDDPSWHKIYICGHKALGLPMKKDYMVNVGGKMVPVLGFVPVESMVGKKLQGSMACALSVLLGKTYFGDMAEMPVHPDRKAGDAVDAFPDVVADAGRRLAEQGLDASGLMPVVDSDGKDMGLGFAGIYPTFVLKEDDKISTGIDENGSNSLLDVRLMGEHIHLSKKIAQRMKDMAEFITSPTLTPQAPTPSPEKVILDSPVVA